MKASCCAEGRGRVGLAAEPARSPPLLCAATGESQHDGGSHTRPPQAAACSIRPRAPASGSAAIDDLPPAADLRASRIAHHVRCDAVSVQAGTARCAPTPCLLCAATGESRHTTAAHTPGRRKPPPAASAHERLRVELLQPTTGGLSLTCERRAPRALRRRQRSGGHGMVPAHPTRTGLACPSCRANRASGPQRRRLRRALGLRGAAL